MKFKNFCSFFKKFIYVINQQYLKKKILKIIYTLYAELFF